MKCNAYQSLILVFAYRSDSFVESDGDAPLLDYELVDFLSFMRDNGTRAK